MARRTELWIAGSLALWAATACDRGVPSPPATSASASAPLAGSAPPAVPSARPPSHPVAAVACRALTVSGTVRTLGTDAPLKKGTGLDGQSWLELDKAAKVAFKHSRSARELSVVGPALVLPCRDGDEHFLLARGEIDTTMGPGARPGAEVLIATPLGTVRYADASLNVRVAATRLQAQVRAGTATLEPATGATLKGEARLVPKAKGSITGTTQVSAQVESCEKLAMEAESLARAVLGGPGLAPDAGTLGERAATHVGARQKARGACTVAAAAVALAPEADRAALIRRLAAAERRWKSVPRPSGAAER